MNIIVASRLREIPEVIIPNTFFGGIGDVVTDETTLASQINDSPFSGVDLVASDIKLFEIDSSNNIRCNIQKPYSNSSGNSKSNSTFYYDFDGNIINFERGFFSLNETLTRVISLSDGVLINQCFRLTALTHCILPNISDSFENGNINQISTLKRVYLPNWNNTTNVDNVSFFSFNPGSEGAIWYFNTNMETIRSGSPHASVQRVINDGGIVRYVQNTDKPNAVTDLSVSNITTNSAQLNFTPPPVNTNANDFYYVYLDYAGISFKFAYNTKQEISAFYDEINASGDSITGLPSGTQISVQIQTVDFYHNVSTYSNKVTFTTL